MTNFPFHPEDTSYAATKARYRDLFPLYNAWWSVMDETKHDRPITEAHHGMDALAMARIALARIGRPTDDKLTISMADAFVHKLEREVCETSDDEDPTLRSVVVGYFFGFDDHLMTPAEWSELDDEDKHGHAAELAEAMPDEVVARVLEMAMPMVLAEVIHEAEFNRTAKDRPFTGDMLEAVVYDQPIPGSRLTQRQLAEAMLDSLPAPKPDLRAVPDTDTD